MSSEPERTPLIPSGGATTTRIEMQHEEIARNWAWIGAFGLFNLAVGVACLLYPVLASQVVELALTYTVFIMAVFHLVSACFSEAGSTVQLLALGMVQMVIAFLMLVHPYGVLTVITFFIAVAYMTGGSYQIAMARQNQQMAARGLTILSGILAIALSMIIIIGLPATSWITIGILIGVNHLNIGFCRLIISSYGFRLSRVERGEAQEASSVLPRWMA